MDKQELFREFAEALLVEVDKMEKRRIQLSSPREMLKELFKGVIDPRPAEVDFAPLQSLPEIPEEFPRLLASYGQKTLEYVVVNNGAEWAPYHGWYVVFPPQQPASRPITTTLEAELEKLKAEGAIERPKEDWQRRKKCAA